MYTIKKITDESDFIRLEEEWNNLLQRSASNNIFLTHEWISTYWKIFGDRDELFILTIFDDSGKIVGIAPLKIAIRKKYGISLKFLEIIASEKVASEYLDFIFDRNKEQHCMELVFNYLKNSNQWDFIHLIDLDNASKNIEILKKLLIKNKLLFNISQSNICPYIILPGSWEKYLGSLTRKKRYNMRARLKALKKNYDVEYIFADEQPDILDNAILKYFELQSLRIEDKGLRSIVTESDYQEFHRKIISLFQKKNWLTLGFLLLDNEYIACIYGYKYNNKYYNYQGGFDPNYKKYGVGTIIIAHQIEKLINENYKEFDFLRGEEEYKYTWTSLYRQGIEIKVCQKNILSQFIFITDRYKKIMKNIIKNVLGEKQINKIRKALNT